MFLVYAEMTVRGRGRSLRRLGTKKAADQKIGGFSIVNTPFKRMRCLRPIEIFGAHMLTGIWQLRARARQGVPDELVCEDVSAA